MKDELEKELINLAPYMFNYHGCNNPQFSLLCFGFCCGDGWFDILKNLIINIQKLDINKEVQVFQIKEKFGTLRFYINGGSDEIHELINQAEILSGKTCEECGKPATQVTRGWIKNLCDECYKKRDIW